MNQPQSGDLVLGGGNAHANSLSFAAVLGFVASEYQKAIFDWIKTGQGNCAVSAVPGSGKTSTLIRASQSHLPIGVSSKFLAFNKHVVEELQPKLPRHVTASTIHSIGFGACAKRGWTEIKNNKYSTLLIDCLNDKNIKLKGGQFKAALQLIQFVQHTLSNTDASSLRQLAQDYDLLDMKDWSFASELVTEVLRRGLTFPVVSYNDMLWLPLKKNWALPQFDYLLVDEAQDLTKAQLEIVLKMFREGSRALFVGDERQAIMGFNGADYRSIGNIKERTKAITLPLSICYRCPKSHIQLANEVHNVIEPAPTAIEGEVEKIDEDDIPCLVKTGDLIICRCLYPLIEVFYDLLQKGIPACVKGQDISQQLLNCLAQTCLGGAMSSGEFAELIEAWFETWKKLIEEEKDNGLDSSLKIASQKDRIRCLTAMYRANNCRNVSDLHALIENLGKHRKHGVLLTTIHGAKGLEADTVFLLKPDLLPHPKAKRPQELEQEKNLEFVAKTRSRRRLFLVD